MKNSKPYCEVFADISYLQIRDGLNTWLSDCSFSELDHLCYFTHLTEWWQECMNIQELSAMILVDWFCLHIHDYKSLVTKELITGRTWSRHLPISLIWGKISFYLLFLIALSIDNNTIIIPLSMIVLITVMLSITLFQKLREWDIRWGLVGLQIDSLVTKRM